MQNEISCVLRVEKRKLLRVKGENEKRKRMRIESGSGETVRLKKDGKRKRGKIIL